MARPGQGRYQRPRRLNRRGKRGDDVAQLWTAHGQVRHSAALQQADPIRQDVEPELDLLPIDGAVGHCVAGDPFL